MILENLIKQKTVAIVGPSPHILGKKLGKVIDSCDVVCRINSLPGKNLEEDFGKRTDVFFHNCGGAYLEYFKDTMINDDRYKEIKLVYCPVIKSLGSDSIQDIIKSGNSPASLNFSKVNIYNIPNEAISVDDYIKYFRMIGSEPNSGIMAISKITEVNINSLFVTGFSFYNQGIHAKDSYIEGHKFEIEGYDSSLTGEASHPQKPLIEFFKNFILKNRGEKIIIDSYLEDVLKIKFKNVLRLE